MFRMQCPWSIVRQNQGGEPPLDGITLTKCPRV